MLKSVTQAAVKKIVVPDKIIPMIKQNSISVNLINPIYYFVCCNKNYLKCQSILIKKQ